jgi:hypothetical protein
MRWYPSGVCGVLILHAITGRGTAGSSLSFRGSPLPGYLHLGAALVNLEQHFDPGGVMIWRGETRVAYCGALQERSCRSMAESQVRKTRGAQCYTGSDI